MARTHDISLIDYHVKDLASFGDSLNDAASAAFPTGKSRYREVHALFLNWEQDNLGVINEILELQHAFQIHYNYDTQEWRIPSAHSYKALRKRISKFLDDFEDKESLLIVYYGGQYASEPLHLHHHKAHYQASLRSLLHQSFPCDLEH